MEFFSYKLYILEILTKMVTFESRVEKLCKEIPGTVVRVLYFTDKKGSNFAVVINQVVWYAIRIIYQIHTNGGDNDVLMQKKSEHTTLQGALDKIEDFKRELC